MADNNTGKKYESPKPGKDDAAHAVARAGISAIPYVGGPTVELFNALITPPLERRRRQWMEEVADGLRKLEQERGIQLEKLQENAAFIDILMHASLVAIRNSQEDKRRALRNAVLNAALPKPPDQAQQQIFLYLVDSFTEWHLRILRFFHNPPGWFQNQNRQFPSLGMGGLSHILEKAFPQLRGRRSFYDQIWSDLSTRGLVNTSGLHTTMSGAGLAAPRTTDIGQLFLRFIEKPS
jgi:hypothetical protein